MAAAMAFQVHGLMPVTSTNNSSSAFTGAQKNKANKLHRFVSHPSSSRLIMTATAPPPKSKSAVNEKLSKDECGTLYSKKENMLAPVPRDPLYPLPSPVTETAKRQEEIQNWKSLPELWDSTARWAPDSLAWVDKYCPAPATATFKEAQQKVRQFAAGLQQLGFKKGEALSLFAENSHRWLVADQATMHVGGATAVRGATAPVDELAYIYHHSESVALITETPQLLKSVLTDLDATTVRFAVLLFGKAPELPVGSESIKVYTFDDVCALGASSPYMNDPPAAAKNDIATLIYTSGTTGRPKGVALTHGNLLHQTTYLSIGSVDTVKNDCFVSILPCWHIFERTAEYFVLARGGYLMYSNKRHFRDDLVEYKPHILVVVPRVLDSLYSSIIQKVSKAKKIQQLIFHMFLSVSLIFVRLRRAAKGQSIFSSPKDIPRRIGATLAMLLLLPLYALASILVFKKIRAALGGQCKEIICGGGSLTMALENFFEAANLNIFVGYGLTETSPVLANRFAGHCVRGSAGLSPPGTQIKILDPETKQVLKQGQSGVILAKGPQVTQGYYKNEEANQKAFDEQGFFNTGDLGFISHTGDLVITGRLKDVIVLNNGENIEPGPIEDAIQSEMFVDQVMLVGQDEKFIGALIVPNLEVLKADKLVSDEILAKIEAARSKLAKETLAFAANAKNNGNHTELPGRADLRKIALEMVEKSPALNTYIMEELSHCVKGRRNYTPNERVGGYRLVLDPFTVENGMMTQTLKIKRDVVARNYAQDIASIYKNHQ